MRTNCGSSPLEFSGAAYRFGHSLVRENYNRVFAHRSVEPNANTPASLGLLFRFTGGGGDAPIPSNWIIDWRRFHDVGDQRLTDFTRLIDTKLIPQLHELPGIAEPQPRSLAVRNLGCGAAGWAYRRRRTWPRSWGSRPSSPTR